MVKLLGIIWASVLIIVAGVPTSLWPAQTTEVTGSPSPTSVPAAPDSPSNGEKFFTGIIPFQNGGPPCMACHNISGIPFPGGGSLGPDLTGVASKFGAGLGATLSTLPFPTMIPIFGKRPLTTTERQGLEAFFKTQTGAPGANSAFKIILPAIGGFIVLIIIIWLIWRNRLITVRKTLLNSGGVRS